MAALMRGENAKAGVQVVLESRVEWRYQIQPVQRQTRRAVEAHLQLQLQVVEPLERFRHRVHSSRDEGGGGWRLDPVRRFQEALQCPADQALAKWTAAFQLALTPVPDRVV